MIEDWEMNSKNRRIATLHPDKSFFKWKKHFKEAKMKKKTI